MLKPHGRRLNVAIVVSLSLKHENIELLVIDQAKLGRSVNAPDCDLLASLRDIGLQIVVVETFACQPELREVALFNLVAK